MVTVTGLRNLPVVKPVQGALTRVSVLAGGTAGPPGPSTPGNYNDTELRGLIEGVKSRSSHTGTQPVSTLSDFLEALQDAVAAMFGGTHTGITFSYNDTAGTITATVSGGGSGTLDTEAAQDLVAAMFDSAGGSISFTYNDTTGKMVVSAALSIAEVSGLQAALDTLNTTTADFENRLTDAEATIASLGSGTAGANGPTTFSWGDASTVDAVTGTIYEPYLILGDSKVIGPAGAMLIGQAASGDVTVELQSATAVAGPWTTVTGSTITIPAGLRRGFTTLGSGSDIATLASNSLIRAACTGAPTGSGGTMTWRTPAVDGHLATNTVTSLQVPLPTGRAAGDLMVACLFINTAGGVTWPTGWTAYGTPFPFGTDATLGPFYLHVATKTAGSSEPTVSVTFSSSAAVITTLGVANGSLVVPTSSNAAVIGTAATSWATPSGLTTPSASCIVAHLAMPRWTSGNLPAAITWDGSLSTDAQARTDRTSAANVGIAVAHLTQASAGAIAVRTASSTGQARALTATLVFSGSSGTTAKGLQIQAMVRQT